MDVEDSSHTFGIHLERGNVGPADSVAGHENVGLRRPRPFSSSSRSDTRSAKPYRRGLTRLGWAQFSVVMGNAVLGGIVVLVGLNPYTVAAHFLLSTALIAVATVMWQRTREGDGAPRPLVVKRGRVVAREGTLAADVVIP